MESNYQKLSKLENNSIQGLEDVSSSVKQYIDIQDDNTLQIALEKINSNPNILQKLFPSKVRQTHNRLVAKQVENIFEAKEQMFKLYTDIQFEITRQKGDALIAATGMEMQEKLTLFAKDKIANIEIALGNSRKDFAIRMRDQLQDIEEYKDFPELSEPYHESLKDEIKIHFSFIKKMLNGFIEAMDRKVKSLDNNNNIKKLK